MIKGAHHSAESIGKMRKSHKGTSAGEKNPMHGVHLIGEKNPMFGKHPSQETREKMRMRKLGVPLSEEHRKRIGKSNKGHSVLEETRNKISENLKGEKHPNWQGGISFEPYCPKFNNEFKERVRAFFNYQCLECGTPQNGTKLQVHHVNFRKDACCTEDVIPLFVPLCRSCHTATNHNRPYWQQHFTEMINGYYGGQCYLTATRETR